MLSPEYSAFLKAAEDSRRQITNLKAISDTIDTSLSINHCSPEWEQPRLFYVSSHGYPEVYLPSTHWAPSHPPVSTPGVRTGKSTGSPPDMTWKPFASSPDNMVLTTAAAALHKIVFTSSIAPFSSGPSMPTIALSGA